jgi:signal transduction histidine kinase
MKVAFVIISYYLICSLPVLAQKQQVDSLVFILKKYETKNQYKQDTNYLNTLNELAYKYYSISPDSTLELGLKSLEWCKKANFLKGEAEALRNIGIAYDINGNYPKALQYFQDALTIAQKINYEKGVGKIYNNIALIYYSQGQFADALDNHYKALKIREKTNDKQGIAISLNNIANVYNLTNGRQSEALELYHKSLLLREEMNDKQGISESLNNIAGIYNTQGNYEKVLEYNYKSLKISQELGDKRAIAKTLNNIAGVYVIQGKLNEAMENYVQSLEISKSLNDKKAIAFCLKGLASGYLTLEEYEKAEVFAEEGLRIAYQTGDKQRIMNGHKILSDIYKAMDKYDLALKNYEKYKIYGDSLTNLEVERQIIELDARHNYEIKETVLKAEQAKKSAELEKAVNQQRWLFFSALSALLFVGIIVFVIYRSRKKLEVANIAIKKLNEDLEKTVEERTHELKITVQNLLQQNEDLEEFSFIISHNLRAPLARIKGLMSIFDPSALEASNQEILNRLQTSTYELDTVFKNLNEIVSIRKNLNTSKAEIDLADLVAKEIVHFESEIKLTQAVINQEVNLPFIYSVGIYWESIIHQLISNAIKYKHPDRTPQILIKGEIMGTDLHFSIKDNGLGVDTSDLYKIFGLYQRMHTHVDGKGLGLYLVKTQVEAMNGTITVESEIEKYALFKVFIPQVLSQ